MFTRGLSIFFFFFFFFETLGLSKSSSRSNDLVKGDFMTRSKLLFRWNHSGRAKMLAVALAFFAVSLTPGLSRGQHYRDVTTIVREREKETFLPSKKGEVVWNSVNQSIDHIFARFSKDPQRGSDGDSYLVLKALFTKTNNGTVYLFSPDSCFGSLLGNGVIELVSDAPVLLNLNDGLLYMDGRVVGYAPGHPAVKASLSYFGSILDYGIAFNVPIEINMTTRTLKVLSL
jgi:hypothetical protein